MQATRSPVVAFRTAADAALVAPRPVHGVDNAAQGNLFWRQAQPESAAGSFARSQETVARQLLQDLGEEGGGNAGFRGDVLHHCILAWRERRHVDESADGILG